jgi:protein subunit release factor A
MSGTVSRYVVVEVRPGVGGEEAARFAGEVHQMLWAYAKRLGFAAIPRVADADGDAYAFAIDGADAYAVFKFEAGVHRVQRVPETEMQGRIHTSTVMVAVSLAHSPVARATSVPSSRKIRTYNFATGWVKDHRVNLLISNLGAVLHVHSEISGKAFHMGDLPVRVVT